MTTDEYLAVYIARRIQPERPIAQNYEKAVYSRSLSSRTLRIAPQ